VFANFPDMVSQELLIELIAKTEIFVSLKPEFHKAIAEATKLRHYESGKRIVKQGEEGKEFFMVVSGSVNVLVEDYALWTEQVVLELRSGQSFGEAALLSHERRSATVQAKEPTVCAVLSQEAFDKLLRRLPEVALEVSRYLASRLSAQCRLTGFRFVSGDQLLYDPKTYRAFSESVLRRCQAIPLGLKGRTVTIALTRPNDIEAIRALQKEVPGLGLEPVACTPEDYESFLHRYRSSPSQRARSYESGHGFKFKRADGSFIGDPLRTVLAALLEHGESHLIVDSDVENAQLLVRRDGFLEPLLPSASGDNARGLRSQIDDCLSPEKNQAGYKVFSVSVDGRSYQLSVSVLVGRNRRRYSIELTDVQSAVPPIRSLFPSDSLLNMVRASLNEPGRIIFLTGGKDSGLSTTLYSFLESRREVLDHRNVLLFEDRPLIPQDQIVQLELGRELEPTLSVATGQKPELIAFDSLRPHQIEELLFHHDNEPTIIATYRGDDLLDVLARVAGKVEGRAPSLYRVSLILRQRLVRRVCVHCCERFEVHDRELKRLQESSLDNGENHYYKGQGCVECGHTGVLGQVPLFEAIRCSRSLLEGLAGLRSSRDEKVAALRDSFAFSYRSFARLLISKGLIDPLEGLRLFPPSELSIDH
jgi:type IV pilus assembly protein PilB